MNKNFRIFKATIGTLTAISLLGNIPSTALAEYVYDQYGNVVDTQYLRDELIAQGYGNIINDLPQYFEDEQLWPYYEEHKAPDGFYDYPDPPKEHITIDAEDSSSPPYDKVIEDDEKVYDINGNIVNDLQQPLYQDLPIDDTIDYEEHRVPDGFYGYQDLPTDDTTNYNDYNQPTQKYEEEKDIFIPNNNQTSSNKSVPKSPKISSPANNSAQALGTNVVLKWEQSGDSPDYYMLYFWGAGDNSSIKISGDKRTYTIDANYFNNTEGTYVLGLYAVNEAGQSDASSINLSLYSFGAVSILNNNNDYAPLNTDYVLNWKHAGKIVANQYVVQVVLNGKDIYNKSISSSSKPYTIPASVFNRAGTYVIGIYAKYGSLQNEDAINVIVDEKIDANRKKVVDYMKQMATIEWTPSTMITYWSINGNEWKSGTKYKGIPYSQNTRKTDLDTFRQSLSNGIYYGPYDATTYLGNDCSSAVSIAWKQANPNFPICATPSMYPKESYISTVGNYKYNGYTYTKDICVANGETVMEDAYKNLKAGDAVMYDAGGGNAGHIRMVISNDSNKKIITFIDQTGIGKDQNLRSSWNVDKDISYEDLFKGNYIPITMTNWK